MKINCEYCDSIIDTEIDKKCPNCNASYAKNKEYKEYIKKKKKKRLEWKNLLIKLKNV